MFHICNPLDTTEDDGIWEDENTFSAGDSSGSEVDFSVTYDDQISC